MPAVRAACAALLFAAAMTPAAAASSGPARVMIVGVVHLQARNDVHNSAFSDDPRSPARQRQIRDVVRHLAAFRPTKVFVEAPMGDTAYAKRYRDFLAGRFTLPPNEVYQFGFRLAAAAGATVVPVDTFGPSLIKDDAKGRIVTAYLKTYFAKKPDPRMAEYLARQAALERDGTYLDLLRYLNSESAIRSNASFYSVLDGMGREAGDAGSAYVAEWYARNCYIFSNIVSAVRPGDRVVVLFGQGHEYLLREFTRLNPRLENVDPLPYLNGHSAEPPR